MIMALYRKGIERDVILNKANSSMMCTCIGDLFTSMLNFIIRPNPVNDKVRYIHVCPFTTMI